MSTLEKILLTAIFILGIKTVGCATNLQKQIKLLEQYDPITIEEQYDKNGKKVEPFDKLYSGLEEHAKKIYIIDKRDFLVKKRKRLRLEIKA